MKPDISKSAWPPPSNGFQFVFNLENIFEAMCPDHDDTNGDNHPNLPDHGELPAAVHDITFHSYQQDQPDNLQDDDTAGPAQTLHSISIHVNIRERTVGRIRYPAQA